ncbi:stalk domain-containing protein [Cohnella sp. JJ-181]|uniref:stalk domain-containing protein n=1 Tax=Cohnella rhizoplanae TaxID=2974897 RepID=UPI0022FF669B|nr:DUF4163 domain-containing protein [Cohnella sp. JJ-181]CAI6074076.1 hypothetical protein COHCIP112018_02412 [Cohnella sp. JJ-181]
MKRNNRSKTLLTVAIAASLLTAPALASGPAGYASAATASAKYQVTATPFNIEGTKKSIGTINYYGSTYIAVRSINNSLGLTTKYAAGTVKVEGRGRVLEFNLRSGGLILNGQRLFTGPTPIIQDDTTYLPLRFLLEQMGYEVSYEQATKLIGVKAIQENKLTIQSQEIGADGDGKSLLVNYPVISGYADAAVQQKINAYLKAEASKHATAGAQEMQPAVDGNNKILAENPKAEIRQPSFDGQYTVTYNEKGKLSLYVDYYLYTGGAHGITARVPYTFDLATGDVLSLKAAAGNKEKYVSIINSRIKAQIASRKLSLSVPFETIEADREYFLSHNGLVIYFTEYEYTPYADGMPEFVIPYADFQ